MKSKQTLFDVTLNILEKDESNFRRSEAGDVVLVHGDTSTTFVTALACFYLQIPVGHVEAGVLEPIIFIRLIQKNSIVKLLDFVARV